MEEIRETAQFEFLSKKELKKIWRAKQKNTEWRKEERRKRFEKSFVVGWGELCRKCGKFTEKRRHKSVTEKILRQLYYFTEWEYCNPYKGGCGAFYMDESKKVYSKLRNIF